MTLCVYLPPKVHIHNPDFLGTHLLLAAIYGEIGAQEKARAEVKEIMRLSIDFSLEFLREMIPIKNEETLNRVVVSARRG